MLCNTQHFIYASEHCLSLSFCGKLLSSELLSSDGVLAVTIVRSFDGSLCHLVLKIR